MTIFLNQKIHNFNVIKLVKNVNYPLLNGNIVRDIWDYEKNMNILRKRKSVNLGAVNLKLVKFGQKLAVNLKILKK
jgi:hypothetical protein